MKDKEDILQTSKTYNLLWKSTYALRKIRQEALERLDKEMSDKEISAFLQEKLDQYDRFVEDHKKFLEKHDAEAAPLREKVGLIEASLGFLVDKVDEYKRSDATIRSILIGVMVTIFVQIGSFIYLWGAMNATVNNHEHRIIAIEDMHPRAK